MHDYLSDQGIIWEFSLAKIPWRGSFYERVHRDLKNILYQKLRRSHLTYEGLSRVIKDIEIIFNNRPLQYVEDEMDISLNTKQNHTWKRCLSVRRNRGTRFTE